MRHNRRVDAILARLSALLFLLCELAGGDRLPGAEKKTEAITWELLWRMNSAWFLRVNGS